ncbi:MAG: GNAT family N-acetyltransferase [Dolichospermum sp. DET50]|nr:GNAT family N-acetyltransferase [Dolichospermum sp. DET66]MBS3033348.1 GNAT family N-acetyltransferase [Dolichospermum sp. DET67]MBS3038552.1 GNAT family N-acetyltransferase [Dolichospermum sp. DET50]QSX70428.1 MAG: GNAT family N-acetyltransferase [Dolichospermum sp. DET69]
MTTLSIRLYAGEADLEAIANLFSACEAVDQLNESISVSELRQALNQPSIHKEPALCIWEDTDDQLVGCGWLSILPLRGNVIDGYVGFRVHPKARGGNLERQIIAWSEERIRLMSQEHGLPGKLLSSTRAEKADEIAVFKDSGFVENRYFFSMARSLTTSIPQALFPAGFTLRQVRGLEDAPFWVEMFNQSFIDHWNHHNISIENFINCLSEPNYRPELDLVAVAADNMFAAFCRCWINSERNNRSGQLEGYISTLGTQCGFRRLGIGRAMLLAGMQQLKVAGMNIATLMVDADNSNRALKLYESVGFSKVSTRIILVFEV